MEEVDVIDRESLILDDNIFFISQFFKNFNKRNLKNYYKDIFKFEGESINEELNCKRKQYFFDELIFEGEYFKDSFLLSI